MKPLFASAGNRIAEHSHLGIAVQEFQRYIGECYRARSVRWEWSRQLIQSVAECASEALDLVRPPVRLKPLSDLFGIRVEISRARDPLACGQLRPVEGGFVAQIWRERADGRLSNRDRFTLAHECGHSLFYIMDRGFPIRIIPAAIGSRKVGAREEGLCDAFAGAILVPKPCLVSLARMDPSVAALMAAAESFEVSCHVLIRRMLFDAKEWGSGIFYCITRSGDSLDSQRFIGSARSKDARRFPTATTVRDIVKGRSFSEIQDRLIRDYGFRAENFLHRRSSLWFMC